MKYNISWSPTAHDTYIFILEHLIETWGTEKAFDFDVKTTALLDTISNFKNLAFKNKS